MHLQISTNFIKRLITGLILGLVFWMVYFYLAPIYFSLVLLSILITIIVFELPRFFIAPIPSKFFFALPLYPIIPFIFLFILNHTPQYRELLLVLFIIVFSFDTGGYVCGSLFGKTFIMPTISPKKNWEGVIGGYLFALVGVILLVFERGYPHYWLIIPPFTLLVCFLALAGDLFESWLKRLANLKDSGTILPGHGGFLDRFDGILFAVIFFYACKNLLIQLFTH